MRKHEICAYIADEKELRGARVLLPKFNLDIDESIEF